MLYPMDSWIRNLYITTLVNIVKILEQENAYKYVNFRIGAENQAVKLNH